MTDAIPLAPEFTTRLNEFARACKAAARAVALYPASHPAIAATLARVVDQTSPDTLPGPLRITVLPRAMLLDGRAPTRVDQAVIELATLLHDHLVGEITVHAGGDVEAWRSFLSLLARTPDTVRRDGGIARLWTTMGGRCVELREIDYAEVLRERGGGQAAVWEHVITSCLQGAAFDLNGDTVRTLIEIAGDSSRLAELVAALDDRAVASGGVPATTAALVRMLRGIAEAVARTDQASLEGVLRNMAAAIGGVSPETMIALLSQPALGSPEHGRPHIVGDVVGRMSDETIAQFVTRSVAREGSSTERIAQAFHALVPDRDRRQALVGLAHEHAMESPTGDSAAFESRWTNVAELLTSYSDATFVSEAYGRELSGARTQAIEVERIGDDPPERMAAWLGTVSTAAVRTLDLTLLLDLLRIEDHPTRWRELMAPVVSHVEDLLLVGDFDGADRLVAVLVGEAVPQATADRAGAAVSERRGAAGVAVERLANGAMLRHLVGHLATIDDVQFERVRSLCLAIGDTLVRPLAEALSTEERGRTRERLTALLIAFGATGRQTVERLKSSPNPAVRRTAIYLLREFGGREALPDLTALLGDSEPQVQREAVRAILNIGTDPAYQVLQQALVDGSAASRDTIVQAISLVRDERATPLFAYILAHVDHRGRLRPIYERAIESLGALRDPEAVAPLKAALHRGEWWAPRRTAILRSAAAAALARIGTPAAIGVLRDAEATGSRRLRAVVRPALARGMRSGSR